MEAYGSGEATAGSDYTERLVRLRSARWKRVLDVQAPYRWNIRRHHLGRTLDVGCGIGRNLGFLGEQAIGVDHNRDSVEVARSKGFTAYVTEEFAGSPDGAPGSYDTLLFSHILEHVDQAYAIDMIKGYLTYLRPGGQVVFITPQEWGQRLDATHVNFVDFGEMNAIAAATGLEVERTYSFPLPRFAGNLFLYNEFVGICRLGAAE
jgi:2-polyprenyl-3-methyl-5-hydroxy-6-metoxy-1,4-benzoquinol methylase